MVSKKAAATSAAATVKSARKKDPHAPKKPMSAYFFFNIEKRQEILKKDPNLKADVREVARLVGAAWRTLGDDEKESYQKKAVADRSRYEKEMTAYKKEAAA